VWHMPQFLMLDAESGCAWGGSRTIGNRPTRRGRARQKPNAGVASWA